MKNDVPKTVLLSFVTNFLGGNPFLLYLCSTAAACTRYRFQSPLPFRKNTFDYHLLLTNSIPHFSRPFLSFVEKCPHINSLRTCVLDDIYLLEKNVYTLYIFFSNTNIYGTYEQYIKYYIKFPSIIFLLVNLPYNSIKNQLNFARITHK